ncbi:MAG: hypothetical protein IAF58_00895 [Leptolyngbya sp.]|nr:hypothetical protein [Candidatus Melainabacteria bacterium]
MSPCTAEEKIPGYPNPVIQSMSKRFHGVKTTTDIVPGNRLTGKNTIEFEIQSDKQNSNENLTLIYTKKPIATRDLKIDTVLKATDFHYMEEPRKVDLLNRSNQQHFYASPKMKPTNSGFHTPNVGDFDKTLRNRSNKLRDHSGFPEPLPGGYGSGSGQGIPGGDYRDEKGRLLRR